VTGTLEVVAPGPLATVQDLGRPGLAMWGVTASGAADRRALRLGNRLVGNPEGSAALEVTFGGARLRPDADALLALTGAPCPAAIDGSPVGHNAVLTLRGGQELRLGAPRSGLRTYVAVRGGLDVPAVLGSRATDVLAGLGPPVVKAGDRLPVGRPAGEPPGVDVAPVPDPPAGEVRLRVRLGPRDDWFAQAAADALVTAAWTVSQQSNRVGLRLEGTPLERAVSGELPSEGMVRGSLQVPPSGLPTLLLADHPITGGYPVIAVVLDADVDGVGQVRPGQQLRFVATAAG
jgi:biotin-dependent carboxylase-like uncharacterized protein